MRLRRNQTAFGASIARSSKPNAQQRGSQHRRPTPVRAMRGRAPRPLNRRRRIDKRPSHQTPAARVAGKRTTATRPSKICWSIPRADGPRCRGSKRSSWQRLSTRHPGRRMAARNQIRRLSHVMSHPERQGALISRNGHDWTTKLPHLALAAGRLEVEQAMLDGEVVSLKPDGTTSFQDLQNAFDLVVLVNSFFTCSTSCT